MKKAADLVSGYLQALGINDEKNYQGFFAAWSQLVGPEISAHAKVIDLKADMVVVGVDHQEWMQRIKMQESIILKKITKAFPQLAIKRICFQMVKDFSSQKATPTETNKVSPSELEVKNASPLVLEEPVVLGKLDQKKDAVFLSAMKALKKAMENGPKK